MKCFENIFLFLGYEYLHFHRFLNYVQCPNIVNNFTNTVQPWTWICWTFCNTCPVEKLKMNEFFIYFKQCTNCVWPILLRKILLCIYIIHTVVAILKIKVVLFFVFKKQTTQSSSVKIWHYRHKITVLINTVVSV